MTVAPAVWRIFLLLCVLLIAQPGYSNVAAAADIGQPGTLFALQLERDEAQLKYGDVSRETVFESVFVSFAEPFADNGRIGLDFGQIYVDGNAQGYRIGLWSRTALLQDQTWHLDADLFMHYLRARQTHSSGSQLDINATGWGAGVYAGISGDYVGVEAGPRYRLLEGDQQWSGISNSKISFRRENPLLWLLRLRLLTDASGEAGIKMETGNGRLLQLYFSRSY